MPLGDKNEFPFCTTHGLPDMNQWELSITEKKEQLNMDPKYEHI
jgi:hypothetical protein